MADRPTVKGILEGERHRLEQELAEIGKGEPTPEEKLESSPFGKREEEATETFELEKRLALENRLTGMIKDVDRALQKLAEGTYGLCDLCHEPIGAERLEAMPMARMCLKCRAAQDKSRGGHRR